MGIQPSEGLALSFHDYQAVAWTVNRRNNPEGASAVEAPEESDVEAHMAELEKLGLVRTLH